MCVAQCKKKWGEPCEISWSIQSRVAATVAAVRFVVLQWHSNGMAVVWEAGMWDRRGRANYFTRYCGMEGPSERPLFVYYPTWSGDEGEFTSERNIFGVADRVSCLAQSTCLRCVVCGVPLYAVGGRQKEEHLLNMFRSVHPPTTKVLTQLSHILATQWYLMLALWRYCGRSGATSGGVVVLWRK